MRIVIIEYVFAGGLAGDPLEAELAPEAREMVVGLVDDISRTPGLEVAVAVQGAAAEGIPEACRIKPMPEESMEAFWQRAAGSGDAVVPIAPETGGALERLTRLLLETGVPVIGSSPVAVALAGSKYRTARALTAAGISVVPTVRARSTSVCLAGEWVSKPDDGCDCAGVRRVSGRVSRRIAEGHVLQPFMPGEPASLSLLCTADSARVLSCNQQLVEARGEHFRYRGSRVAAQAVQPVHQWLASAVFNAIPGLYGFAGIDFLVEGERLTVLEVNPRPTTSVVGLQQATGIGPGLLISELLRAARCNPSLGEGVA